MLDKHRLLATPETGEPRHHSPLAAFAGFAPWIAYWALIGSVSFRLAVLVAFGISLAVTAAPFVRGERPKVFELGGLAVFAALLVVTFATNDDFLERWIQPLTNGGILAVSAVSLAIGRPFTLEYARDAVTPDVAAKPGFTFINSIITGVWTAAFAVMTVSAAIPPIVEGDATIREGGSTLSIIGYWVVPFSALGLAAAFSGRFPDWFVARIGGPAAPAPAKAAPLEAVERPRAGGSSIAVEPREGLLDASLALSVAGASPGAKVRIEARTIDALGRGWRSEATFHADEAGNVDAGAQPPVAGTWDGADADAAVWSMRPDDAATDLFVPHLDRQEIAVTAEVGGGERLGTTLVRHAVAESVRTEEVRGDGFAGRLFIPPDPGPRPGVAVLPGSEGGLDSMSQTAAFLASHGYVAMVVAYFGAEGLGDHLVEVPLERIAAGVRALGDRPEVEAGRVGALAISKGSEGLLAAAAHVTGLELAALVAISPSRYVWQAVGEEGPQPGASSWTLAGRPLPFAEMRGEALMPELLRNAVLGGLDRRRHRPTLLHLAAAYSLKEEPAPEADIPVEGIQAPILLLAGEADELWPSAEMASRLIDRRGQDGDGRADELETYPRTGHLIRMPLIPTAGLWTDGIAFGGTPEGLGAAQRDASRRILDFLGRHL